MTTKGLTEVKGKTIVYEGGWEYTIIDWQNVVIELEIENVHGVGFYKIMDSIPNVQQQNTMLTVVIQWYCGVIKASL